MTTNPIHRRLQSRALPTDPAEPVGAPYTSPVSRVYDVLSVDKRAYSSIWYGEALIERVCKRGRLYELHSATWPRPQYAGGALRLTVVRRAPVALLR